MEPLDLRRYQEKLVCEGVHLPDPRCVPDGDWKDDLSQLPKVTFPDIYVYLINSNGKYTSEKFKACKSLSSWDLCIRNTCYWATTHIPPSTADISSYLRNVSHALVRVAMAT